MINKVMLNTEQEFVRLLEIALLKKNQHYISKREVRTGNGIPDLVLVDFDNSQIDLRLSYSQKQTIPNESFFRLLNVIPDCDYSERALSSTQLSDAVPYSTSYIRSSLIPFLIENNYIISDDGKYLKVNGWAPLSNNVIAIEAKLHDWKRAIMQAVRYKTFANQTYIALPPQAAKNVDRKLLKKFKIGLIEFNPVTNEVKTSYTKRYKKPKDMPRLNYVNEQVIEDKLLSFV